MKRFNWFLLLLIAMPVFLLASCDEEEVEITVVDIALSDDAKFSSLVAALTQADLVTTLQGEGPFTVFAPTNDAFDAFLTANGFSSLSDVPNSVLTQVLLNHVVSGDVTSGELTTGYVSTLATEATTSNPISIFVDLTSGVKINASSTVTEADIEADNGVVHVVDAVIGLPNVVTHAVSNPDFSSLVAALTRADLTTDFVSVLSGTGPFTVFAPTNAAFQALLDSDPTWNSLNDIPVATLEAVLTYHVVSGANVLSSTLSDMQEVTTLQGGTFIINIAGEAVSITDANNRTSNIIATDVQGSNGVVHAIDTVILP